MWNSAKHILAKIASKHGADYLEKIPVITGNRAGVVDAGDGKIWVRFSTGLEARVINTLAPLAFDRHIMIGRLRTSPNVWRVAEIREVYIESDSRQFMPHHLQHEFGGFDQVNISRKQIISATAFVSDSENFLVRVYGGLFQTDSGWVLAQSTDGTPAHPDLDLSAEVPTAGAVYVGIESDSSGVLSLNVGTPFAAPELATGADVPIPPDGSRLIAFVLLYDSQTALLNEHISVPGLFASVPGSAGAVAWGDITGTITDQTDLITEIDAAETAAKAYADSLVVGLWDDRGSFDASGGAYPSSGGSGTAGAILKGDIWTISVAGTLPTGQAVEVGDIVRALVDTPGNTQANWAITQNNIGYVAENQANKATTMAGNTTSNILYLTAKAIYDWGVATFAAVANGVTGGDNHNHELGAGDTILLDNQSIADTTSLNSSTSAHGFLKKLSNVATEFMNGQGNWTRVISAMQTLFTHGNNASVPASTTYYLNLATFGLQTAVSNIAMPACTVQNLILTTNSAQPASGSLVVTVQKNNVDTAITFTIAAGAAAATFTNTANSVAFAAGDACTIKLVNNATGASALITRASLQMFY